MSPSGKKAIFRRVGIKAHWFFAVSVCGSWLYFGRLDRPQKIQNLPEFFFKRVWAGFLPLASYLFLVLCFKSAGLQPEFGLSGLACHAKSKSVEFFCSPALLEDPRLEATMNERN